MKMNLTKVKARNQLANNFECYYFYCTVESNGIKNALCAASGKYCHIRTKIYATSQPYL